MTFARIAINLPSGLTASDVDPPAEPVPTLLDWGDCGHGEMYSALVEEVGHLVGADAPLDVLAAVLWGLDDVEARRRALTDRMRERLLADVRRDAAWVRRWRAGRGGQGE